MEYQNILIKRKEHFGLIWLAAHCSRKISKSDVLRLDLTKKCNDLCEYIGKNKKSSKKKISLQISSHLMKGLVTILYKKHVYLYDELVNLKFQLSQTYTLKDTIKKKKTAKILKPVDQDALYLKEQLPDLMDISCVENMVHLLDKTGSRYRNVTMSEADDFSNTTLIPVEYDYTIDMFGGMPSEPVFLMPQIEDYTLALEDLSERPGITSTGRKPAHSVARAPFGDLTNIEKIRDEQSVQESLDAGTVLAPREETHANQFMTTDFGDNMPALFEPTVMEPVIQETIGYDNEAQNVDINQIPERGMVKTFSADITALREEHLRKREVVINRKRKNLIVDSFTEMTLSAAESAKRRNRQFSVGSHEYAEQARELHEMFREKNTWRGTRYEFQSIDLIKEPLSMNALRTSRTLNLHQLKMSINYRHLIEHKCLTTGSVIDDENFYLTQARDFDAPSSTLLPSFHENTMSMAEEKRQANESETAQRRLSFSGKSRELRSSKSKRDSMLKQTDTMNIKGESRIEEPMPFAMEPQPLEPMSPMQPLDSFIEGGDKSIPMQVPLVEISSFEALIIQSLDERDEIVLQDLIRESSIPEKCRPMQKPRLFFASKMFLAALNLASRRTINLKQESAYNPIKMTLRED